MALKASLVSHQERGFRDHIFRPPSFRSRPTEPILAADADGGCGATVRVRAATRGGPVAPVPDLPALAREREGSIPLGPSALTTKSPSRTRKRHSAHIGARRRVAVTLPASRPCAGRCHKWLRTERGSLAPSALGAPATELGSNNGRRNSARGLQSVRQWRVLSRR